MWLVWRILHGHLPSSSVMDWLQALNLLTSNAEQQSVTLVQSAADERVDQCRGGVWRQRLRDSVQLSQLVMSSMTETGDLIRHRHAAECPRWRPDPAEFYCGFTVADNSAISGCHRTLTCRAVAAIQAPSSVGWPAADCVFYTRSMKHRMVSSASRDDGWRKSCSPSAQTCACVLCLPVTSKRWTTYTRKSEGPVQTPAAHQIAGRRVCVGNTVQPHPSCQTTAKQQSIKRSLFYRRGVWHVFVQS